MSGRTRSYFCLMSAAGRDSLQVYPLIISVRWDSCGAIPSTTGMLYARRVIDGRLIECVPCLRTWMRFDWITSAASPQHGTFPQVHQRPSQDNGYRVRLSSCLKRCVTRWDSCRSLSKIWELLLRMYRHCATSFNFPGHGFCSSPSTVIQITPIYPTTLARTQLLIPGPMTIRQLGNGMKNYPTTSGRTSGVISSARQVKNPKLLRH